jgi:hypothetical protein
MHAAHSAVVSAQHRKPGITAHILAALVPGLTPCKNLFLSIYKGITINIQPNAGLPQAAAANRSSPPCSLPQHRHFPLTSGRCDRLDRAAGLAFARAEILGGIEGISARGNQ